MRNLKKILALVMALVMSLSLVTIANASDFTDADEITYEEAADVMSAIGVIEGFEDGSFDPDGTLTREQAAKMVTYMLLGDNAENLGIERSSFNDVAMDRWSAPAIEYCVSLGIIDGAGDGNFYPAAQLTGAAFAKMLLTALGYDADTEGLVGATWSVNTAALAMEVGLDNGIETLNWNDPLSREEAAQMGLNAICAPLVAYEGGVTVVVGDTPVSFGSGDAYYITTTLAREQRISDEQLSNSNDYTVEFGERYFPRLRLVRETDEFERPSHTWVYENTELGTYVDYELLVETYTAGVSGRTLYELLSRSTIEDYDFTYYVDGVESDSLVKNDMVRSETDDVGETGNGVLTQVFVDHDDMEIIITSINTWLARANNDYNENSETVSLRVYDVNTNGSTGSTEIVDSNDVANVVDIVADQYVLVNMSGKDSGTRANMDVVRVNDVEILTDTDVTKFSNSSDGVNKGFFDSLTADGEEYSASAEAHYNEDVLDYYDRDLLTDTSYNVYLDQYGYAIGVDLYEGELNYVFITGYDRSGSYISIRTATAAAIFLDGSMSEITVNVTATNRNIEDRLVDGDVDPDYDGKYDFWNTTGEYNLNRWYTYTENDGVYTLRPVNENNMLVTGYAFDADYTEEIINCSNVWVADNTAVPETGAVNGTRGYGNDDSIYITVEPGDVDRSVAGQDQAITEVSGLYTGVQNVELKMDDDTNGNVVEGAQATGPNVSVFTVTNNDQYIIASIVLGEAQGSIANYAYILDAPISERIDRETNTYYWEFEAIMAGEIVNLEARSKYQDTILELVENRVVELRFDGDYVVGAKLVDADVVTFEQGVDAGNDEVFDVTTYQRAYQPDEIVDLYLTGRTLHTGEASTGLTFVSDAPAVLRQPINGDDVTTEYASVQDAYNDLGDADTVAPNLQFQGRIVALLNGQGVAEWVFIDSDTSIDSNDHHYGNTGHRYTNGDANLVVYGGKDNGFTAESVSISSTTSILVYTVGVPDDWTPGDTVAYDWELYVNGEFVGSGSASDRITYNRTYGNYVSGRVTSVPYDEGDEVVIYVDNIHQDYEPVDMPVDSDVAGIDVTFTHEDGQSKPDGGELAGVLPYDEVTIRIQGTNYGLLTEGTVNVTEFIKGQMYRVYVNTRPYDVTCDTTGVLEVDYTVQPGDDEIVITAIRTLTEDADPDEPITAVAITVTAPKTEGDDLADPKSATTGVKVTGVWTPNATTAVAGKNTLTITIAATGEYELAKDYTVTVNGKPATVTDNTVTVTFEADPKQDIQTDDTVKAVWDDNNNKYTFQKYGEDQTLTDEEIIAAIAADREVDPSKVALSSDKESAIINGNEVVSIDPDSVTKTYEVTIGANKYYVPSKGTIEGLTGIYGLLPADKQAGSKDAIGVNEGVATMGDLTDDVAYAPALKVATSSTLNGYTVQYATGDVDAPWAGIELGSSWVQVGTQIRVTKNTSNLTEGETLQFSICGETTTVVVGEDKNVDIRVNVTKGDETSHEVTLAIVTGMYYVEVNGVRANNMNPSKGQLFAAGDQVFVGTGNFIIGDVANAKLGTGLVGGIYTIQSADKGVDGVIAINSAVEINSTATAYGVFPTQECESGKALTGKWVKADATVYVQADSENVILAAKEDSKYTLGTAVVAPTQKDKGVWAVTLNGKDGIGADEFVVSKSIQAKATNAPGLSDDRKAAITIDVVGMADETATFSWKAGGKLGAVEIKGQVNLDGNVINVNLTVPEGETVKAGAKGTLVVTVGGLTAEIEVTATASAGAGG